MGVVVCAVGCAVPVAPSGGPPDSVPPVLAESDPVNEATSVEGAVLSLTFSEYVDERSFPRAFDLTPAVDGAPTFSWRGRRVEIRLPQALRAETTYRLTLGTDLRDANGVRLDRPITLAFSTGPTISRGRLAGRVVRPAEGKGTPNVDVYAYPASFAEGDTLARGAAPLYRTQTDSDGRFELEYLAERGYHIVALRDGNRNRRLDAGEAVAAPPRAVIVADSAFVAPETPWVLARADTTAPRAERLRARSTRRIEVRFDEAVVFPSDSARADAFARWRLIGGDERIWAVTAIEDDQRGAFVWLESPAASRADTLALAGGVRDSAGLVLAPARLAIPRSSTPDTSTVRLVDRRPEASGDLSVLLPGETPTLHLSRPPTPWLRADSNSRPNALASWLEVTDAAGAPRPFSARTGDGLTFSLRPDPALTRGDTLTVRLIQPATDTMPADTLGARRFTRIGARDLGSLSAIVAFAEIDSMRSAPGDRAVWAELLPTERAGSGAPRRRTRAPRDGLVTFADLPAGAIYRLRVWADWNDDGAWTSGSIAPFRPAEPLIWSAPLDPVRARWDTVSADTLLLPGSPAE